MRSEEKDINMLVMSVQNTTDPEERKALIGSILSTLEPLRYALARKFSSKGVEFDDIVQQIDLKLIEAIYDYNAELDPSALRHLAARARNGIWNFYRKEMNYFDDSKKPYYLDSPSRAAGQYGYRRTKHTNGDYHVMGEYLEDDSWDEGSFVVQLAVTEELGKLTPHQQRVLQMYFIEDKTQYDIAGELEITQANVSRAKKRAINQLRNNLMPLGEPSDTRQTDDQ